MVERYSAPSVGRGSSVQLIATGRNQGEWVRYSDHEAELATLRARVEELERERDAEAKLSGMLLSWAASHGEEPDLLVTEWQNEKARAERAEEAFEIANNMRLEATRLAVEALEPFVAAFDKRRSAYIRRYSDPAIGRTNFDKMPDKWPMEKIEFSMGAFRRARTALDRLTNIMGESN